MRSQLLPLNKANQKPEKLLETLEWKVKIIFGVPHPVDLSIFFRVAYNKLKTRAHAAFQKCRSARPCAP